MNSRRSKNEIATTSASISPSNNATHQKWPLSARNVHIVYVWLPHILTPAGRTTEVRDYCAISSAISAVRFRWRMFLSRPLNLQGAGGMFAGKRGCGDKGRWVKYWASLGCWISPCYGHFSLGSRVETYKPFISLIFHFFFGPRQTAASESADTGVRLDLC